MLKDNFTDRCTQSKISETKALEIHFIKEYQQ